MGHLELGSKPIPPGILRILLPGEGKKSTGQPSENKPSAWALVALGNFLRDLVSSAAEGIPSYLDYYKVLCLHKELRVNSTLTDI